MCIEQITIGNHELSVQFSIDTLIPEGRQFYDIDKVSIIHGNQERILNLGRGQIYCISDCLKKQMRLKERL